MVSNSNTFAVCGFLCLLILCTFCNSKDAFASAFIPHNAHKRSQQQRSMPSPTTTAIAMGGNDVFFAEADESAANDSADESAMDDSTDESEVDESTVESFADESLAGGFSDKSTAGDSLNINREPQARKSRLVWLTGFEDLRLYDHGGFTDAFAKVLATNADDDKELIIPVFVIDPKIHLRSRSESVVKRLHESLESIEKSIAALTSSSIVSPLVVRTGSPSWVLPSLASETNAVACHVVEDDVVANMRTAQQTACTSLTEIGVEVVRWTNRLRPSASWSSDGATLPSFFPDYCEVADKLPVSPPVDGTILEDFRAKFSQMAEDITIVRSEGVPSLKELLDMAESVTPDAVLDARSSRLPYCDTTEPFDAIISEKWSTEKGAKMALEDYCRIGNDGFTNKHFIASDAANKGSLNGKSMYASSIARLIKTSSSPAKALALREGPTRAFSSALNFGVLSQRDVLDAARNRSPVTPPLLFWDKKTKSHDANSNRAGLFPSDVSKWGRSSEGSLSDVIEWREWFHLLAQRSLSLQEEGKPGTSGGEKEAMTNSNNRNKSGDPRESGTVNYWRWKGQHLVRYLTFPAGKDYYDQDEETRDPAILLVHGFAASGEQWERLVHSIRQKKTESGKDTTPPIYAVDLLGFGHSEKPSVSYTQYLWESQLVDFAVEVMDAVPMVMAGNSIGGGLSAGAAASLGKKICRGLVLLNTAGILVDPDNFSDSGIDAYTKAAIEGNPEEPYSPVPLFGNNALDVFGDAIIGLIYPQIEKRLSLIYGNRIENADPSVVYAIQQGASSPGSSNVIGCGQKLAPNRPLNEVLMGVGEKEGEEGFPVLVVMGLDDRVSSPEVAKFRAEVFSRVNPDTISVKKIEDAGHCPHDESPEMVANYMLEWMNASLSSTSVTTVTKVDTAKEVVSV